jgi:hypothetical protein
LGPRQLAQSPAVAERVNAARMRMRFLVIVVFG